jgi:hypothetical protein
MRLNQLAVAPLLWILFASIAVAQDSAPRAHLVNDWSNRHVVFSGLTPENLATSVAADPRAWHSWVNHARHRFERRAEPEPFNLHRGNRHHTGLATDWQMPIGAQIGPTVFPAKFSFDVNAAPDCANDYIVFPTNNMSQPGSSGSGVSASLVAFNNLYTGPGPTGICPTPLSPATQPSVLFAYNTSTIPTGRAARSPVLSLDGKKIAFVESNDGSGNTYTAFHVLTWKAGEGTAWNSAAAPGDCSPGNSCMTTLVLNNTRSDSKSSPFVDYAHDAAYVGDDAGQLHKITPVFSGTPAEVIGNGWPVQLDPPFGSLVQAPVYDSVSGRLFVTDGNGTLYIVNAVSGAILNTISVTPFGESPSDPIVDSADQTVFVFGPNSSLDLAVWQYDTAGTLLRSTSFARLAGTLNVYTGAFDNNYFTSPSSGLLYLAGAVNGIASLFAVGFTGTTMNASFSGPLILTTSSTTSEPTPLTEIFNPSFSTGNDRLFLGINANCAHGSADGCVESFDISHGFPSGILSSSTLATSGGDFTVSGIVVDNVSSAAQASSIYFESSPPGNSPQSAIKLTQSGLQ